MISITKKANVKPKPMRVNLEQSLYSEILYPRLVPKTPTMKPPKWPIQSIPPSKDVKSNPKMIKNPTIHIIWHLRIGDICPNAVQLIIRYPRQQPKAAYRQVDAPTLIELKLIRAEKKFAAIAAIIQRTRSLKLPKVCSTLDVMITVEIKLPKKCIKFACNTAAVITLHTYPFLINCGTFAPIRTKVELLAYNRVPASLIPTIHSAIKTPKQMINKITVRESGLMTGQHVYFSISQQSYCPGGLTLVLPETKSTFFVYMISTIATC